jgi:hypothetical protein
MTTVVIMENDVLLGRGGKKTSTGNSFVSWRPNTLPLLRATYERKKPLTLLLVHLVQTRKPGEEGRTTLLLSTCNCKIGTKKDSFGLLSDPADFSSKRCGRMGRLFQRRWP